MQDNSEAEADKVTSIENENSIETPLADTTKDKPLVENASETVEDVLTEIVYTYKWKPKRTAPPNRKFSKHKGEDQGEKGVSFRSKRGKGPKDKFGNNTKSRPSSRSDSRKSRNTKPVPKRIDPDHPFAALMDIRDKL